MYGKKILEERMANLFSRGFLLFKKKNYTGAIKCLKEMIKINPNVKENCNFINFYAFLNKKIMFSNFEDLSFAPNNNSQQRQLTN